MSEIKRYNSPAILFIEKDGPLVSSADYDALLAERDEYKRLFIRAVTDMASCACEWGRDPDNPNEHTDKITTLCGAHEELFDERTATLREQLKEARELLSEIRPYVDSLICYASTINEHLPNGFPARIDAARAKEQP